MSLSKACDDLLTTTSILNHEYGIPAITATSNASKTNEKDLHYLESSYHDLYGTLTSKLNRLLYLSRMEELSKMLSLEIDTLYEETFSSVLLPVPKDNYTEMEMFLTRQLDQFKTKTLLNKYLAVTLPILRSIHHNNANLTVTELNILSNLKKMFSRETTDPVNMNTLLDQFEQTDESRKEYIRLRLELSDIVDNSLKPKLQLFDAYSQTLHIKKMELTELKKGRVQLLEKNSSLEKVTEKFHQLVETWTRISVFCDLLPNLIISNPTNWYNDKKLLEIMNDCDEFNETFGVLQLVINIQRVKEVSPEELLLIDLDQLEQS